MMEKIKKGSCFLLALCMVFLLAACDSGGGSDNDDIDLANDPFPAIVVDPYLPADFAGLNGSLYKSDLEIEEEVIKKSKGIYIVDGMMNIDDFFELIDYKDEFETDYSTVGGFIQELKGDFAHVGDRFKFSHYRIKVIDADEYTVKKIQIRDISKSKRV